MMDIDYEAAAKAMWLISSAPSDKWKDLSSAFRGRLVAKATVGVNAVLVPDGRLQAIADAWRYDDVGQGRYELKQQWPELADLLDALTEEEL